MASYVGGSGNTAIGANALLRYSVAAGTSNGSGNTAVGNSAGSGPIIINLPEGGIVLASGTGPLSNDTFIGDHASVADGSMPISNSTAIGANAKVSASNAMVLGATGANQVNVDIGTTTPQSRLQVASGGSVDDGAYAADPYWQERSCPASRQL